MRSWNLVKWDPDAMIWVSPRLWPFEDTIYYTYEYMVEHPRMIWWARTMPTFLYIWLWIRDFWKKIIRGDF